MAETDKYEGRRPSFDKKGNGRGFRSKPGAPMADSTSNFPMSPVSGTPKTNWDSMFKNSLTGNNPLSIEARTPAAPVSASPVDTAMSEIFGFPMGAAPSPVAPPSLNIMAQGGPNHGQLWGGESLGNRAQVTDVASPLGGTKRTARNKYGWGSSYLPT